MEINVRHIAKLVNLVLKDDEIEKFGKQLSAILDYVKKLQEIDLKDLEEGLQATTPRNVVGEDISKQSLPRDDALSGAKNKHNGYFKVKGILNKA